MLRYIYIFFFSFFQLNSSLALGKVIFQSNNGKITYNMSKNEQQVVKYLVEIQNAYLKKDAKLCLKVINSWNVPDKIKTWVFIKKLKCIGLLKKKTSVYIKNISPPEIWMLDEVTKFDLVKELKVAIYFLINQYLALNKEAEALKLLELIDEPKFFKTEKEKSYLFYIKSRTAYSQKYFTVAKNFLKNSFYHYRRTSLKRYPHSLSYFKSRNFTLFFQKKEKSISRKKSFDFPEEIKFFKKNTKISRKKEEFFEKNIKYLKTYSSAERSSLVNKKLLSAYLSLGEKQRNSFNVINKIASLECKFLDKWVGKLFYKAGYVAITELYKKTPNCHWTAENYFRISVSYYYLANYPKAKALLSELPKLYSGHELVPRSMLFLAFSYIKGKEYKRAISILKGILRLPKTDFRLQAYYFLYSLHKKQKKIFKAKFYYKQLLKKYPLTYYSLKLRLLNKPAPSFFINKEYNKNKWILYLDKREKESWGRVKLLLQAGWHKEAQRELKLWGLPIFSSGIFVYTYLLSQAHDFLSAIKLLHYLWRDDKNFHRNSLLKLLFPHFFGPLVEKYALKNNLDPNLVFSLIRQESAFKVDAHSFANAYGLMQMIISTANEVKKLLGLNQKRISKYELFKPKLNIRFGSRHLRQLIKAWKGHIPLALASYNVGYGNLSRWIKARGKSFEIKDNNTFLNELWFDELPWMETSFYIKAILRNQILYKGLYKVNYKGVKL